jgi:hypothetical protein
MGTDEALTFVGKFMTGDLKTTEYTSDRPSG